MFKLDNIRQLKGTFPLWKYRPKVQQRELFNHQQVQQIQSAVNSARDRLKEMANDINRANASYKEAKLGLDFISNELSRVLENNIQKEEISPEWQEYYQSKGVFIPEGDNNG